MLYWPTIFLVLAILSVVAGAGGATPRVPDAARVSFFVFLTLSMLCMFFGSRRRVL
jgi:uncharacterized membrane protein YtjA (UPF0391 family)